MLPNQITELGYGHVRTLQGGNHVRFFVYLVEKEGVHYVAKVINHNDPRATTLESRLENQVRFATQHQPYDISVSGTAYTVRAPRLIYITHDLLVMEYVPHLPIFNEGNRDACAALRGVGLLAAILAAQYQNPLVGGGENLSSIGFLPNLEDEPQGWKGLGPALERNAISSQQLTIARILIREHGKLLRPAIQHTDFTPAHVRVGGNEVVLIDSERNGENNPHLYDLAFLYANLVLMCGWEPAKKLLQKFLNLTRKDVADLVGEGFLAVLCLRALGICCDASPEDPEGLGRAQALLDAVLKRNLHSLT